MSNQLKPEVKTAWLEALRSGAYDQGRSALREHTSYSARDTYCCLGVLCEVAIKSGLDVSTNKRDFTSLVDYDGSVTYLPDKVYEWATTDSRDPHRRDFLVDDPRSGEHRSLSALNDNGRSFREIADLIEEQL